MKVILCEPQDSAPEVWGTFENEAEALKWLEDNNYHCPNPHHVDDLQEVHNFIPYLSLEQAIEVGKRMDDKYPPTNLGLIARAVYVLYRHSRDSDERKLIGPMLEWMNFVFEENG